MSDKNNNLLQFCRYYKGEDECPLKDNYQRMFWYYEKDWTQMVESGQTEISETFLNEYVRCGLTDFQFDDDTPVTLKATLFNRFCKSSGLPMLENKEPFKKFYLEKYLA